MGRALKAEVDFFDPDLITLIEGAIEKALLEIKKDGSITPDDIRTVIALSALHQAKCGEENPSRMVHCALEEFRVFQKSREMKNRQSEIQAR